MAQRLATEYVKTSLVLTEAEMISFIRLFSEQQVVIKVHEFENGSQEILLYDEAGEEIALSFERKLGKFVSEGSCRLSSIQLANLMRKAVSSFKGDAVVHRIYPSYTIVYYYSKGHVVKIVEVKQDVERIIYEYKDTLGQMEQLFRKKLVEEEITGIQSKINRFLDMRNQANDNEIRSEIDIQLQDLTHRLFVLEA